MTRPALAPIAMRIATSRRRAIPCTSSRLATSAQAISSTSATAPRSSASRDRVSPPTSCSAIGAISKRNGASRFEVKVFE